MVFAPLTDKPISVVIPVLNEAEGLPALLKRLPPALDQLTQHWEVVFVDDGSTDDTLDRLRAYASEDPRIKTISLSRNFGKEIAIAAGLRHADGAAVIIMDADLQHPPEILGAFVEKWLAGFPVVYGQRLDRKSEGPFRRFFARAFYRIFNALVETDIPKGAGDFRLMDRRAVDALNEVNETSRFNKGLYSWIGFKSTAVPFTVANRQYGTSKWQFSKLLSFAIDGITSFTTLPLRVWSFLGVIISGVSIAYAIFVAIWTVFFGGDVPGYASLIVSIMFLSGVQLISLGVLGQYLGRVYEEVKNRPLFIVAEKIGFDEKKPVVRRRPEAVPSPATRQLPRAS